MLALAIATLVGAALLVWELRSGNAPAAAAGGPGEGQAGAAGHTNTSAQRGDRGGAAPGIEAVAGAGGTPAPLTPDERASIDMERVLAGEVPQRVRAAASGCYDGSHLSYKELENDAGTIDLDFKVILNNGTVTLQNVRLAKGIGDADLEQCVVEAVSEISWEDPVNPDFSVEMSDAVSLLALRKWGEPMPHELEEVPESPEEGDFGAKVR